MSYIERIEAAVKRQQILRIIVRMSCKCQLKEGRTFKLLVLGYRKPKSDLHVLQQRLFFAELFFTWTPRCENHWVGKEKPGTHQPPTRS